jgi:hypothetical protein
VRLKLGAKVVWEEKAIPVAWDGAKKTNPKTTVDIPAIKYDTVHIEVVEWVGGGGGLAEIELIRNGKNIALRKPAMASAAYSADHPEHCTAQMVNDGIVDEGRDAGDGKGYWLLPTGKAGWIEVFVGPTKVNR